MKKFSVLAVALLVSPFVLGGCGKSELQKYADELCECKDAKCLEKIQKKYADKMPKGKEGKKLDDLPNKDKEAVAKALACALEIGLGAATKK